MNNDIENDKELKILLKHAKLEKEEKILKMIKNNELPEVIDIKDKQKSKLNNRKNIFNLLFFKK